MTPELETANLVIKAELHKELHAQTRQFVTWMGIMVALNLGGIYFLLTDIKNDLREIRGRLSTLNTK